MTISVVSEICSAARIKRPEPLHAISDRVTGRRTVGHGGRSTIIASTIVARTIVASARAVGGGQRAANDCPPNDASGNRWAPSPTSASPLHGLGRTWDGLDDREWLADGCGIGGASEQNNC
jgi:hypothetical protein